MINSYTKEDRLLLEPEISCPKAKFNIKNLDHIMELARLPQYSQTEYDPSQETLDYLLENAKDELSAFFKSYYLGKVQGIKDGINRQAKKEQRLIIRWPRVEVTRDNLALILYNIDYIIRDVWDSVSAKDTDGFKDELFNPNYNVSPDILNDICLKNRMEPRLCVRDCYAIGKWVGLFHGRDFERRNNKKDRLAFTPKH